MALKNPQFNAIIRQYDLLRQEHNHHREERLRMIYKNIPEYEALDEEIAHIAAECARKAVLEPGSSASPPLPGGDGPPGKPAACAGL